MELIIITCGVRMNSDIQCMRCSVTLTQDEVNENTEPDYTCRKCTQMQQRFRDFYEHTRDEAYFTENENVPSWEHYAWLIMSDAQDSGILKNDLDILMEDKDITVEDYRKIIEILAKAFVQAQFDDSQQELPR